MGNSDGNKGMDKIIVNKTIDRFNDEPSRLMDILIDIQDELGFISDGTIKNISNKLDISQADIKQTVSFYHFFSTEPRGKYTVYLNDSVVANMMGRKKIAEAFEEEVGCKFNNVSSDGLIGLFDTSCIGMNDQEPAAIINGRVFTKLTTFRVKEIVEDFRKGKNINEIVCAGYGDGMNNSDLIKATVENNIMKKGPVILSDYEIGSAIKKIISMKPEDVIQEVKLSKIRGRGGAGFPTGLKWEFCRRAKGEKRFVFCNADEGEPGTFKDRVLLTEYPQQIFEGMTIAGYAIGASEGILYVRYEYRYLRKYLENVLDNMRKANLIGKNIGGKDGFNFDIRIQSGAGAYVCGEESALIESAEGKRGEPRDRPPFPVEKGYLNMPTVVNNVETLSAITKIFVNDNSWYKEFGTLDSTGTKVLSISGDCKYPGVYEVEWGFNIYDILEMVGADFPQAVQVGGPSGSCIAPNEFDRTLCYSDLSTGGSLIIIGKHRNLLKDIVLNFTNFFIEESCGSCVPCRELSVIIRNKLEKIINGNGVLKDIDDIVEWAKTMKVNRCGLGQAAMNPILTTIKNFRYLYETLVDRTSDYQSEFNLQEAVIDSCFAAGRKPILEVENKL